MRAAADTDVKRAPKLAGGTRSGAAAAASRAARQAEPAALRSAPEHGPLLLELGQGVGGGGGHAAGARAGVVGRLLGHVDEPAEVFLHLQGRRDWMSGYPKKETTAERHLEPRMQGCKRG
jgi:hypothetical protein